MTVNIKIKDIKLLFELYSKDRLSVSWISELSADSHAN